MLTKIIIMSWFIFFAELLHAFSLSDGIQIALQHNKEVEMAEVKFEIAKSKTS